MILGTAYASRHNDEFKVIEMQIMDLADDIAYSTYDFEDALKAGFGSPIDLLQQLNNNDEIRVGVARKIFKSQTGREYPISSASAEDEKKFEDIQTETWSRLWLCCRHFGKRSTARSLLKNVET
jgi:dGTP triphosphohydrolase